MSATVILVTSNLPTQSFRYEDVFTYNIARILLKNDMHIEGRKPCADGIKVSFSVP